MFAASINVIVTSALLFIAAVAGSLASFLWLRRPKELRHRPDERQWPGAALDVTRITPRIERLRKDYVDALHSRPHPLLHASALLAAARDAIRRLAYFRESGPEHDRE